MLYIKSYYELINSYNGINISIHKRNNVLKAEKELKDKYGITYVTTNGKFEGTIGDNNKLDAQVLFDNLNAKPEQDKMTKENNLYFKKKIENTKALLHDMNEIDLSDADIIIEPIEENKKD